MNGDFRRYLDAKVTVDARAVDGRVRGRFRDALAARAESAARGGRVRLLEAGCGTGATAARYLAWEGRPSTTYVAVDREEPLVRAARARVREVAGAAGLSSSAAVDRFGSDPSTTYAFVVGDALDVAECGPWDAVVAQTFADLLGSADLDRLLAGLAPGGLCYLPITFDGGTKFHPPHPADEAVERRYHASMDRDGRLGSAAGRRLLTALPERGVEVVAAGGSSWIVADHDGRYPGDERYFLRVIVDTVAETVAADSELESATLADWAETRRSQVASGELQYVAHGLDVLGRSL